MLLGTATLLETCSTSLCRLIVSFWFLIPPLVDLKLVFKRMVRLMDANTPKYSEGRYDEIVKSISSILRKTGCNPEANIPFIPISGLEGENIIERSTNLDWSKGPTLLEALDQIQESNGQSDKPLRLPLENV
ncbi:hypothetical protein FEM48_Zijuj07G0063100 [Ziziphus jujuba var. spinosa]|uniref:Uncharacterized protein n=1 Tax=Ziziphus jujuba var. spinosa TaxID=714518 RepID=A0A978V2Z2_ZIZJJ|nr:hypothetical protein FEM48_Zijuj07G0063100 [Ziziphus jujuba var. spinosa]